MASRPLGAGLFQGLIPCFMILVFHFGEKLSGIRLLGGKGWGLIRLSSLGGFRKMNMISLVSGPKIAPRMG